MADVHLTAVPALGAGPALDPVALAGADACRRMMLTIETLPEVEGELDAQDPEDDGIRRNYLRADLAITEALDGFATNRGFRLALANYLLTLHSAGTPAMERWTAKGLLDDGGCRPPDTLAGGAATSAGPEVLTIPNDRQMIGLEACWETEALCEVARGLAEEVAHSSGDQCRLMSLSLQLRGVLSRIEALNGATMSVLDREDDTQHLQRVVFGRVANRKGPAND